MADNQNQPILNAQPTSSSNEDLMARIEKYFQDFVEIQESWKNVSLCMRQNHEYLKLEMERIMVLQLEETQQIKNAGGFDQIEAEIQERVKDKRSDMVALYILMMDYLRMIK